jgi:hypothetical protein
VARRTGRFPQLADPRSGVNGLFLIGSPGFRAVSLDERPRPAPGSSSLRPLTPDPSRAHVRVIRFGGHLSRGGKMSRILKTPFTSFRKR